MNLSVRMSDGSKIALEGVSTALSIRELKGVIEHKVSPPCAPDLQRLIFKGRILKDTETVVGCGVCSWTPFPVDVAGLYGISSVLRRQHAWLCRFSGEYNATMKFCWEYRPVCVHIRC